MKEYRLLKKTSKILSALSFIIGLGSMILSYYSNYSLIFTCIAYFFLGLLVALAVVYIIILKKEDEKFTEETIKRITDSFANMNLYNTHNVK